MKKTVFFLILILTMVLHSYAAVPSVLTYSGKITDKNNSLLTDGKYDMIFSFYTAPMGGSALWTEPHYIAAGNGVTVTAGGFNVLLGQITALPDFNSNYYLQTDVIISGVTETFGRRAIESVSYARRAEVANLANQVADNCITSAKIAAGTIASGNIGTGQILNGNIGAGQVLSGNIGAGQVANGNIAAGAVDQSKAPFAPRIIADGTWRNNALIQAGTATTDVNGDIGVTFPAAFSQPPTVVATSDRGMAIITNVYNISATSFAAKSVWTSSGAGGATIFHWIAIGY